MYRTIKVHRLRRLCVFFVLWYNKVTARGAHMVKVRCVKRVKCIHTYKETAKELSSVNVLMRWESICVYLIRAVLFWYQSMPRVHKLSFSSVSLYLSPTIQKFYQRSIIEKSKGWGCQNGSTVDSSEGKMFQIRVDNSNHRIESKLMNVFWSNNPHDNEATVSWKSLKTQSI